MQCPNCGYELVNVYAARSVELEKDGDKWIEKNVFSSAVSCPSCHEELSGEQVDELGINAYWP